MGAITMDWIKQAAALISALGVIVGLFVKVFRSVAKITNGQKAMLRKDMTDIYYAGRETRKIRQYEFENATLEYEAYKALGGNSFVDKIYDDIKKWEIVK